MQIIELNRIIGELYEENRLKQVFEILKEEISEESERRLNLVQLIRRFNAYNDRKIANTILRSDADVEVSKIGDSLFNFIQQLEQSDLGIETKSSYKEISNSILVFTKEESIKELHEFFLQLNFINVEVRSYEFEDHPIDDFDLIVFDNQDLPVCRFQKSINEFNESDQLLIRSRVEHMQSIINSSTKIIIHFGDILYWIYSNRDRVQAANSKFSLHARTLEVIDFINAYRV